MYGYILKIPPPSPLFSKGGRGDFLGEGRLPALSAKLHLPVRRTCLPLRGDRQAQTGSGVQAGTPQRRRRGVGVTEPGQLARVFFRPDYPAGS